MANNYYDSTGVLVLDKVTPIIEALFGGLNLDASYPGDGEVYIARMSEGSDALWDDIAESLSTLADNLGVQGSATPNQSIAVVLERVARYFGAENDEVLSKLIKHYEFEDVADMETLFQIATCFDDGHGLKAIVMEAAWHSSKPRLFEFGGEGLFISREVVLYRGSSSVRELGSEVRDALLAGNVDKAAERMESDVVQLLNSVRNEVTRHHLRIRLATKLMNQSPGSASPHRQS